MRSNAFLFDEAIAALRKRSGRTIVELGAIRSRHSRDSDGHSTLRWPHDVWVWSVDVSPSAIALTRKLTIGRGNVVCVLASGIDFLNAFPTPIDLLYLDGPHPDREDGRRWHHDAYRAANLGDRAVVLIDDTDVSRLGKAEHVVPAAVEDGFEIAASGRQTLLVR